LVIWLLAGGGESELGEREGDIKGIVCFFEKHFPDFIFHRVTPVRNKRTPDRVKSNAAVDALGKTGEAFAKQIKAKLDDKIKYGSPLCDAILIVDDLDCCYDESKNSCHDKLSELLIESSRQKNQTVYSKVRHTPFLLYESLKPDVVAGKCPIFRDFFTQLQNLNQRP